MTSVIDSFTGAYSFLACEYPHRMTYDGNEYPSAAHAFWAQRTLHRPSREPFFCRKAGEQYVTHGQGEVREILSHKLADVPGSKLKTKTHKFRIPSGLEARIWGMRIEPARPDWGDVKLSILRSVVEKKFLDFALRKKLSATGDAEIVFVNQIPDTFMGMCRGVGENQLGKILMEIREFFVENGL